MGRSSERRSSKASHHPNLAMFRFVALFALVAVAFAEPEADPQLFYNHWGVPAVPVVKPVVPVVKYVDPHHTEGMTKDGVPEKTDSVKIAEKQHEIAHMYENAKKTVVPYVGYPYAYTYPYAHSYVPTVGHVVAKREAEGESDPYLFYNNHLSYTGYPYTTTGYTGYPYTTTASFPYTTAVAGYPYTTTMTGYHYPYTHTIAKREAEGDAQYFYRGFTPYTSHAYNYANYHFPGHYNTWYGRNAFYY